MSILSLSSPAKINLYLKVHGRRPDGYHDLTTVFQRVDLCDELRFWSNRGGRIRIRCADRDVPTGSKNLVYRAARMLQEDFALENGAQITIRKRIPVAAGLGGGSSNAATALLGLNRIWKLSLPRAELLKYAARLGSDVPFFLYDCSWAVGTGRGDRIRPLPVKARLWQILVTPRLKVYSRNVYQGLNLHLTKKDDNVNILIRLLNRNDVSGISRVVHNDLAASICRLYPHLSALQQRMQGKSALTAAFSGSGPTLFGLVESKRRAEELRAVFAKRYRQVFAVRTL